MAGKLLEIEDLRTHIRLRRSTVKAVDGVSLAIELGETVGLVGESGCGKTMTGMSIMRLLPPGGEIVSGRVRLEGRDITRLGAHEMRAVRGNEIGMVFQDPMTSLNPTMTIGRQISEPVRIHRGASREAARARAEEVLGLVGMPRPRERLDDYPHQLSGGLRQRAMIAMALACEPKLLIADEPTTALDVTIQDQILSLLRRLKEELGMAILLITHDMGVIAGQADAVMVMYAGRIVETTGTPRLFRHVRHPYTEALLASIPQLDQPSGQPLYRIPGRPPDLSDPPSWCRFEPRCQYATGRCRAQDPPLIQAEPGHRYACFHPVGLDAPGLAEVTARSESVAAGAASSKPPDANDDGPLLVVSRLVKEFPVASGVVLHRRVGSVKAVSDISFAVDRQGTFGLVGESGCGKTTVGRLIAAIEDADSGTITFDGIDLASLAGKALRRRRRDLQLMFQDPYASLDPRMRVGAILREPLAIQHIGSRREQDARIAALLEEVGLAPRSVDRYPHEFSGGQRQRIGLARALILQPKLIVADEPVSALDVSVQSQILNLMKSLQAAHGLTLVVISHDLSVVRYLADRIGVMYLGKLVEIGGRDDIYERPAHPYTAGLLESIPVPDPVRELRKRKAAIRGQLPSALDPPSGCRFRTRCPRAQDRCASEEPILQSFEAGHVAACHFPLWEPRSSEQRQPSLGTKG